MLSPGVAVDTYGGSPAIDNCGNPVYKGAIIDPATTGVTPVGTSNTPAGFGCVFVNNHIPTNRISKVTSQILQLYHQYYQPESTLDLQRRRPGLLSPIRGSTTRRPASRWTTT